MIKLITAVCFIIIGLWKYSGRKAQIRRELAEKARKDLDNANKNDNPSDFIDAFNWVRK